MTGGSGAPSMDECVYLSNSNAFPELGVVPVEDEVYPSTLHCLGVAEAVTPLCGSHDYLLVTRR